MPAAIVSSSEEDLVERFRHGYPDVLLHSLPSPGSSTFENVYTPKGRIQHLRAIGGPLSGSSVPPEWRERARVIHLGPLAQELPASIARDVAKPGVIVGVTPQGWMRKWDANGRVSFTPWISASEVMQHAQVLVFSEEDVHRDQEVLSYFVSLAQIAVVTRGENGATLYVKGQRPRWCPAFRVKEIDPTGCGDVFAASFFLRLAETNDPYAATEFACCVASFCIEAPGLDAIPHSRAEVEKRLREGQRLPWDFGKHSIDVHQL
jgi:sugar/nucleoside kinase (ribokinase family)